MDSVSAVEPRRWRGRYVSPAERQATPAQRLRNRHKQRPDLLAPDVNPEMWARLVVVDAQGRPMFEPNGMAASSAVRYADRDRILGMEVEILRGFHPLPVMTVNLKAYPVTLYEQGWRKTATVYADVGARKHEQEWFDALQGRVATISHIPGSSENIGPSITLRIGAASFGTVQKIVVGDDGPPTPHVAYEGRLELRETWSSFLSRQTNAVLESSFLIVATGLASGVAMLLLTILHGRLKRVL